MKGKMPGGETIADIQNDPHKSAFLIFYGLGSMDFVCQDGRLN